MSRIIIKDLSKDQKITKEEMKRVLGGMTSPSQAILPQGEDLMKAGAVQNLRFASSPYAGYGLYSGSALFGGRSLLGGLY